MSTKLVQIEQKLVAPMRDTCEEKECLVGRICRLVDEVEIDVKETNFVGKVRKLEEHLFGVPKEGTFLERIRALELGKGIGLLENDDRNHVDLSALVHQFEITLRCYPVRETF